jgi:2',3'-cyclic-nucleotide 2'-phosphodiesterase (5'-nucleotidase family)
VSFAHLNRIFRHFVFFLSLCTLGATARQVPITLLHTAGIQGQLSSNPDTLEGGLLRCAELIAQARESARNTLLVDSGDFLVGTPESEVGDGALILKALSWLNYTAIVPGDHDLTWGGADLKALPLLAANTNGADDVSAYRVLQVDGVRVVLIGLAHPGVHNKVPPEMMDGQTVSDPMESLSNLMPEIRSKEADIVVLIVHQGLGVVDLHDGEISCKELMFQFPEIDVVIGGRTGRKVVSSEQGNSIFTQASPRGLGLGQVDLVWDTVQRKLLIKKAQVMKVSKGYLAHGALVQVVGGELSDAHALLDEVIADSEKVLPTEVLQQAVLGSVADVVEADVVLGRISSGAQLPAGKISRRAAWKIVDEDQRIVTATFTGLDLKNLLEENAGAALASSAELAVYGVTYALDREAEFGKRVSRLQLPDGKAVNARKHFVVALPHEALVGADGTMPETQNFLNQAVARASLTKHTVRTCWINSLQKRGRIAEAPREEK